MTHVAVRFEGKTWSLPAPNRHHDVIRHIAQETGASYVDSRDEDQGFLDESGRYLTRRQALASARLNGQVLEGRGLHRELYSEDVW